ncbi:Exocyst complex component 8 [Schistosoma japonicum]|uniref:Exocyst complex component 8 n=1 Tax=Schistosoma japonicum TaxID=6182 RepID=A0A4Z2D294_SCHJA|nr:Exocyst complex component 8 [Schistosoma japonicum]
MSAQTKLVQNSNELEVSDIGGLRRVFAKSTFNSEKFARNISKNGEVATSSMLEKLNIMSSEASTKMKRAVFENYKLFIKAGKAASQLENTMHQIHNEFTEKQRVINTLTELSLFGDIATGTSTSERGVSLSQFDEKAGNLPRSEHAGISATRLAELVEGASVLIGDSSRRVIFDGDLRELSMKDFSFVCMARVFVLTDTLIIAFHNHSGSPYPYRLQSTYDLNNFAVANFPPMDHLQAPNNAFKVIVFPTNRLFQTETPSDKKRWLTLLDETMRKYRSTESNAWSRSRDNLDNSSMKLTMLPPKVSAEAVVAGLKALSSTLPDCVDLLTPIDQVDLPAKKNPFDESFDNSKSPTIKVGRHKSRHNWLWDVPEDLDVAISERNFQHATNLIVKARESLNQILTENISKPSMDSDVQSSSSNKSGQQSDAIDHRSNTDWEKLSKRIERNERNLTESLQYELLSAASRHGAPKSVKSAVSQLGLLGKAILAAELFLVYRSQVMTKALTHGVHQEGNQLIYLNKLSLTFHRNLAETAAEWCRSVIKPLGGILSSKTNSISQQQFENVCSLKFYSWTSEETEKFAQQLRVLLIDSHAVSFYSMAYAAQRIKAHADKLTELLGVDVSSTLNRSLSRVWKRAADEQSRLLCEAVENRAKQESWETLLNLPKGEQEKTIADLVEFGVLNQYTADDYGLKLTMSIYYLIRSLRQFIQSVNLLNYPELDLTLVSCFVHTLNSELDCFERVSPIDISDPARQSIIVVNLEFLINSVVPKFGNILNCYENSAVMQLVSDLKSTLESIKGSEEVGEQAPSAAKNYDNKDGGDAI